MEQRAVQVLVALVYLALGRYLLLHARRSVGMVLFAIVNVLVVAVLFQWTDGTRIELTVARSVLYLVLVAPHYWLLRRFSTRPSSPRWPAVLYPITLLVLIKYTPPLWQSHALNAGVPMAHLRLGLAGFVGLSYLSFRLSHLAVEVRNGVCRMPSVAEYVSFAFFVPTMLVGPISPGSTFLGSLDALHERAIPAGRCAMRILVGATKYLLLGGTLVHLTYADLWGDGHPHAGIADASISAVSYYLYLYCNFSGFCDMAIGGAGLLGISVVENFDRPLTARNIKEFWSRWHITLSNYVREMMFSPLSKELARVFGPKNINHAVAIALLLTFIATGVWHGVGLNFFLFGLLHGAAMVSHHYYTLSLRKRLSRQNFKRYQQSKPVLALAVALTFSFNVLAFFVFANDLPTMARLWNVSEHQTEQRLELEE